MRKFKCFAVLFTTLLISVSFVSCGDDDDDNDNASASSAKLVGRSFAYYYSGVDGDENPEQWTITITFKDATNCSVNDKGFWYIWYDGYKKESWNKTGSCTYSVSGDRITLHNYPFLADGGDVIYTYKGTYLLSSGGDVYSEK